MLIGYVGISLMATISFKQLVFISSPIYMIGYAYYDIQSKALFDSNMINQPESTSLFAVIQLSLIRCIVVIGVYWLTIDRELAIFFESKKHKRQKENIEQVFHCQKDFVFVLKTEVKEKKDLDQTSQ